MFEVVHGLFPSGRRPTVFIGMLAAGLLAAWGPVHATPAVVIHTPGSAVLPYAVRSADLAGVATNVVGVMAWSNALTQTGGSFPAATNWTVTGLALGLGANGIIVTGTNAAGTAAADSVVLTRRGYAGPLPFAAAIEDDGSIYAASWSETNFAFTPAVFVDDLRRNDAAGNARAICAADFDGDGDVDLVAFRYSYTHRAPGYLLLNDGTNRFTLAGSIGLYGYCNDWAMDAAAGDFDNDGRADVVVGGNNSGSPMGMFLGDGAGRFRRELVTWDTGAYGIEYSRGKDAADFDHDGHLDLAVASCSSGNVYVFFGLGNGLFGRSVLVGDVGTDPYGVAAGDFDGDGHPDIIANYGSSGDPRLYLGAGDGTFTGGNLVPSLDCNNHGAFDAFDFDQDGDLASSPPTIPGSGSASTATTATQRSRPSSIWHRTSAT